MRTTVADMLNFYAQVRRVYISEFTRRFQESGFSPNELDILLFLSNNPSINTSSQLCTCLNVSKALTCRSVDALTERGFLTASPDPNDRRVIHLFLTAQADPVIEKLRGLHQELDADLLNGITQEELDQVQNTLQKILKHFQAKEKGE